MKRTMVVLTLNIAVAAMLAFTNSHVHAASADAQVEVKIDNFSFGPATLTVPAGTTITWVNRDDIPHTVVSEDQTSFKSHALDTDDKFSHRFEKRGTYTYFCSIHPKMTAKVVVR